MKFPRVSLVSLLVLKSSQNSSRRFSNNLTTSESSGYRSMAYFRRGCRPTLPCSNLGVHSDGHDSGSFIARLCRTPGSSSSESPVGIPSNGLLTLSCACCKQEINFLDNRYYIVVRRSERTRFGSLFYWSLIQALEKKLYREIYSMLYSIFNCHINLHDI